MNSRKKKILIRYSVIITIILILVNGFIDWSPNNKPSLIIKGSTSVEPFVKALKNELRNDYKISLSAQGSGTGITSLFDQKADIAMSSRDLKPEEQLKANAKQIETTEVAKDGISVIINKELPISNLTKAQIKAIYTGEINNWNQINKSVNLPINVVARDEASGTREGFDKLLQIKHIVASAKQIEATGEVMRTVGENKGTIGYVSSGSNFENVNILAVDGVKPSVENIKSQKYELFRRFYLLNYKNNKTAHKFVKDTLTPKNQKMLVNEKYKANFISVIK